jgi:hypothetical protein
MKVPAAASLAIKLSACSSCCADVKHGHEPACRSAAKALCQGHKGLVALAAANVQAGLLQLAGAPQVLWSDHLVG